MLAIMQSCLGGTTSFGIYPIAMISKDTGQTSAEHVNLATIRNFKGLEADVVFILDTDKMEKEDKRVLYTQASRARLWLGVMGKVARKPQKHSLDQNANKPNTPQL